MSSNQKPSARRKAAAPVVEDVTLAMPHVREALDAIHEPTTATKAWGTLYAVAAAYLREGKAPPAPIAHLMAERLTAISQKLLSKREKDKREAVFVATLPQRQRGRKAQPMTDSVAEDVLIEAMKHANPQHGEQLHNLLPRPDLLRYSANMASLKDIDAAVRHHVAMMLTDTPASTLRTNARKLRNTLKKPEI